MYDWCFCSKLSCRNYVLRCCCFYKLSCCWFYKLSCCCYKLNYSCKQFYCYYKAAAATSSYPDAVAIDAAVTLSYPAAAATSCPDAAAATSCHDPSRGAASSNEGWLSDRPQLHNNQQQYISGRRGKTFHIWAGPRACKMLLGLCKMWSTSFPATNYLILDFFERKNNVLNDHHLGKTLLYARKLHYTCTE